MVQSITSVGASPVDASTTGAAGNSGGADGAATVKTTDVTTSSSVTSSTGTTKSEDAVKLALSKGASEFAKVQTLLESPTIDASVGYESEGQRLRKIDHNNTQFLSSTDPKSSAYYSIVRDAIGNTDDRSLILSERGIRNIKSALDTKPDPRIQGVVDAYNKAKGSGK